MLLKFLVIPAILAVGVCLILYITAGKQFSEVFWKFASRGLLVLAVTVIGLVVLRFLGVTALFSGTVFAIDTSVHGEVTNFGLGMIALLATLAIAALVLFLSVVKILTPAIRSLLDQLSRIK